MSEELQAWLRTAPFRMKRELAGKVKEQADRLAEAVRAKVPVGKTGRLRDSVRVRRTRNELKFYVTAGVTREYNRDTRYEREVRIGSDDTQNIAQVPSGGFGVTYDYARAVEFGTQRTPAQPFFYNTAREMEPEIRAALEQAVAEVINR